MFKAAIANKSCNNTSSTFVQKSSCAIKLDTSSKYPYTRQLIAATATILVFIPAYTAQATDSGTLLREQQNQQDIQRLESLPLQEEKQQKPSTAETTETGKTIIVNEIRFTGKTELLPEQVRTNIAEGVTGKRIGIVGIQNLVDTITSTLQQQGHLLASVILPQQDITEGTITFQIVDGRLSDIAFDRSTPIRANEERLQTIADNYISSDQVTKSGLEEALLRINDHPGVTAKARLAPGDEPNTSNLLIDLKQAPIFSATASIDNSGSYSTGREQLRADTTFTDISGHGDLTKLMVISSEGQTFANSSFSAPIGVSDFIARANYGYLDYHNIDDTGKTLELEGYAHFLGLGLDYSLIRSRDFNLHLNSSLNAKALVDDSISGHLQDKRSLIGTIELAGDSRDRFMGNGITYWSAAWSYGDLDLSGVESALSSDQAGLKTNGQFQRVNASLTRLQKLPATFSLFGRVRGQWANKNLDSSEDFSLGGPYSVRGWPIGEGRGDMGTISTIELRYDAPTPTSWGQLQFATFFDAGHIWVNKNPNGVSSTIACGCNDYSLTSAGVSALWTHKFFNLSATYAQGIGDNSGRSSSTDKNADNSKNRHQFWLTAMTKF
ncbi:ShlB/FhaC/HecB family hemolysin secretion/activation protein [Marinomonas polaris]|uniref:ShlB/FhaC/HecB family hemolysin secretion/activation protein n=1 Tax=Marinomonas polaris TaxID=293552 RepID=UPI003F962611